MKANINDKVCYNGETHTVTHIHTLYELDGICVPVDEADILVVDSRDDRAVIEACAKAVRIPVAALLSHCRRQPLPMARHAIWKWIKDRYDWSYTRIGRAAQRDHSSIVLGVQRFTDLLEVGDVIAVDIYNKLKNL